MLGLMTRRAKLAVWALGIVVLLGVGYVVVKRLQAARPTALPIARDTTYLTEPLDGMGRVDFAAALNGRPFPAAEENAAIPLMQVVGTDVLIGDLDATRALLGTDADLPTKGALVPQPEEPPFFQMIEDVETEEEREAFRAWIKRNEKALELLQAASLRPRLMWPYARGPDSMLQSALPYATWTQITDLLNARAESRRIDGQPIEAWRSIEMQLRLARLLDASPVMIWRLIGGGMRSEALSWVGRALASGDLDEAACAHVRRTLLALPPPAGVDSQVIRSERIILLDAYICQVAEGVRADGEDPSWHPVNVALTAALREINQWFDKTEAQLRPTAVESTAALQRTADDLKVQLETLRDELDSVSGKAGHLVEALVSGGTHEGRLAGTVLVSMVVTVMPMVAERPVGFEAHRQLVLVALAVRMHERRTGTFPAALSDLDPATLPDLSSGPVDLDAITYERDEDGCSLDYSSDFAEEFIEVAAGTR